MQFPNPEIRRPLLRRTLRQALLAMGVAVVVLSVTSFVVARGLLLERASLHAGTLGQATVDLVEQELTSLRRQAVAVAHAASGTTLDALRTTYPSLLSVETLSGSVRETTVRPGVDRDGWQTVTVTVPQSGASTAVTFTMQPLLERLATAARASGRTADVVFGRVAEDRLQVIRASAPEHRGAVFLESLQMERAAGLTLADAIAGMDRTGQSEDYRGVSVVAAGRFLPSLGWGVSAQIDAEEVLEGVKTLAVFHALVGAACLLLAALLAGWLAYRWTAPIRSLTTRAAALGPGSWDMTPSLDTQDEVAFFERVMSDMAQRLRSFTENLESLVRQRTQALREQFELDRAVLTSIEYGVMTVNAAGAVTGMNPAAETLLGLRLADALGKEADKLFMLSHGKEPAENPLVRALHGGLTVHTEPAAAWDYAPTAGEHRSFSLIAAPLKGADAVFGAVMVFQDVTREREMEQLKSEFITLASHQLRTPLSIMQWQLEALHGTAVPAEQVTEMETAAKRMTAIVNALLQVAKLEGGSLTPVIGPVDLALVLRDAVAQSSKGATKDVQVRVETPDVLPCRTDPVLLNIVFQNLLENAAKYSKEHGSVHVAAALREGKIVVTVQDDGMGIPLEEQRHVFEKFFRGKNIRKQSTDGTGLGLYIAKMITEQLGGTLTFVSSEGQGTTFTVELPKEPQTTPTETR